MTSCYRFHEGNGVGLGGDLVRLVHGGRAVYKPMLEHIARRHGRERAVVRVRTPRRVAPPVLTPAQIDAMCDACASWDAASRAVRAAGCGTACCGSCWPRPGCGWAKRWGCSTGTGTPAAVTPRSSRWCPATPGARSAGQGQRYRRLFISDELDRLYGEYLWQLCDAGADLAVPDLDAAQVFVNLAGGTRFAPWRPDSVYDLVNRLRRDLAGQVPQAWTPHWMRHSHATALLLAGVPVHVVSRRLGHADVQTTLELYAHVTEDAELRAARRVGLVHGGLADRAVRRRAARNALVNGGNGQAAAGRDTGGDWPSLASLQAAMPGPMRQPRFAPSAIPSRYASAIRHGSPGQEVDLSPLPGRMRQEMAWCLFRIIEIGGTVSVPAVNMLARRVGEVTADRGGQVPGSLLDLPVPEWSRQIAHAVHRRTGQLPAPTTIRNLGSLLARMTGLLAVALDAGPWWRRDDWDPVEDGRIPLREHEPMGRYTVRFGQITAGWLRAGAAMALQDRPGNRNADLVERAPPGLRHPGIRRVPGRRARSAAPRWPTGPPRCARSCWSSSPGCAPARPAGGAGPGSRCPPRRSRDLAGDIEQFYAYMADSKDDAAAALDEPGWLALGPEHYHVLPARRASRGGPAVRWRARSSAPAAMTQIMAGDRPARRPRRRRRLRRRAGHADHRCWQAVLGLRINEICMLDPDPLLPLLPLPGDQGRTGRRTGVPSPGSATSRPRSTAHRTPSSSTTRSSRSSGSSRSGPAAHDAACGAPGTQAQVPVPRLADEPQRRPALLRPDPAQAADPAGRAASGSATTPAALVDFNRTHRFRHTAATSLLNAGVPIHVVQRYLGHLTPAMTMHYAQTLAETAEAEFLRFRKLTADARPVQADPRDLYDMLQLDSRTDRILPNGWCMLPPRQSCDRGNACLTCGKFVTDATLPARAAPAASPDAAADRDPPAGLHRPHRRPDERRQHLAARPPARNRRARRHHHGPGSRAGSTSGRRPAQSGSRRSGPLSAPTPPIARQDEHNAR